MRTASAVCAASAVGGTIRCRSLAGRYALVCAISGGMTLKAAAAVFSVLPATAHRWWHRWLEGGEEARATLSCLFDRSSRPRRSPRQLAPELAAAICACRRETGWGPRLVAGATGFCHSTVWKVLKRAGISRPDRPLREASNRYAVVDDHSRPSRTGRAPTGKWNACIKRWRADGRADSSTNHTTNEPKPCHTGSRTTTPATQLARRPPLDEPHSQRPWAGHLAAADHSVPRHEPVVAQVDPRADRVAAGAEALSRKRDAEGPARVDEDGLAVHLECDPEDVAPRDRHLGATASS